MGYWTNIIASLGSGQCEFRLVIEGCKYIFVTHPMMRGTLADGRIVVPGLDREGIGFSETAYLAGAELDIGINPFRIVETPEPDLDAATSVFSKNPIPVAWLAANVEVADPTATVHSANGLSDESYYHVGTEVVKVTNIAGTTLDITRAQWGTTDQAHRITNDAVAESQIVPLMDGVEIWKGRRWWLYAVGPAHVTTGGVDVASELTASATTGEIVMRGILSDDPQQDDDTAWTLAVSSRWDLFDQEVAAATGIERRLRGAYYPGRFPFQVAITRHTGANLSDSVDSTQIVQVVGHYENQDAWCAALIAAILANATIAGWGGTWRATATPDGRWELYYRQPSASPRFISIWGGSPVDGWFDPDGVISSSSAGLTGSGGIDPASTVTVTTSTEYQFAWRAAIVAATRRIGESGPLPADALRLMPRSLGLDGPWRSTDANDAAHPMGRLYLDNVSGLATGDRIVVPPSPADERVLVVADLTITAVSTGSSYIDAYFGGVTSRPSGLITAGESPVMSVSRSYASGTAGQTLGQFIFDVIDDAPDGANDASTPWLLDDDVSSGAWLSVTSSVASDIPYLARRLYTFHKGVRLEEVVKQECRLYGLYPYLDSAFQVSVRALTLDTAEVSESRIIEGATHLTDERRAQIRVGTDGHVNVVEISQGYDPVEDKYTGRPIHVRRVASIARAKKRMVLEIRPKTRAFDNAELTEADAYRLANPIFAMFGGRVIHLVADVPMTFWGATIGSAVMITDPVTPYDGYRGVHDSGLGLVNQRAIVVGREWDLSAGGGTLTLLVTGLEASGYTPTARVSIASNVGGNVWDLTVEQDHYGPTNDDTFFAAGDNIRLIEWDATSPTVRTGQVVSVNTSTHVIQVGLSSAWGGLGGAIYNLECSAEYDSGLSQAQLADAYIADLSIVLDNGGDPIPAKEFAP